MAALTAAPATRARTARRRTLLAVLVALATLQAVPSAHAQQAYTPESVKAAYLYRFAEFIEWPAPLPADGTLTIAVLGDEGIAAQLRRSVEGRRIQGLEVRARRIRSLNEAADAHILFVSEDSTPALGELRESLATLPVVIVTESANGLREGAVINFVPSDGRLRFEVSLPAAERRGLKLSSRLLAVAMRVEKTGLHVDPLSGPRRGDALARILSRAPRGRRG